MEDNRNKSALTTTLDMYNRASINKPALDLITGGVGITASKGFAEFVGKMNIPNESKQIGKFQDLGKILSTSPMAKLSRKITLLGLHSTGITATFKDVSSLLVTKPPYSSIVAGGLFAETFGHSILGKATPLSEYLDAAVPMGKLSRSLATAAKLNNYGEQYITSFPWRNLGTAINVSGIEKGILQKCFFDLAGAYKNVLAVTTKSSAQSFLNPTAVKLSSQEYFTTTRFLKVISKEAKEHDIAEHVLKQIKEETESDLEKGLIDVNGDLVKMWRGAVDSLSSNNPDKFRHFAVSIRELFTHLIHLMAPDQDVLLWSADPTFVHEQKPTRKGRFAYIVRELNDGAFKSFVQKDLEATTAFINLFQPGTHAINSPFTQEQINAMKVKAEGTLLFLLSVYLKKV